MKKNPELFLDANAHLPLHPEALKAMAEYESSPAGHANPMSPSPNGQRARRALEKARESIARRIGADPNQLFITGSCSQACEWGVRLISKMDVPHFYTSPFEHPAVSHTVQECIPQAKKLPVTSDGSIVSPKDDGEIGIICTSVHNETGVIQPLSWALETGVIRAKFSFSDMTQEIGKSHGASVRTVDFAAFGAHKFGGPVGVGFLYVKETEYWEEFGCGSRYVLDRPGTPDVSAVIGAAAALKEADSTLDERHDRMKEFRDVLEPGLKEMGFVVIGETAPRCPGTTFVKVPKRKAGMLMTDLGNDGVHVGLGSACGAMSMGPSPLIEALGLDGDANDYLRISQFGHYGADSAKLVLSKIRRYL